jgi:large subunit ribosomal protein L35
MRAKGMKSHLRRRKSKRSKRLFDEMIPVHASDQSRMKRLLPYGTG